MSLKPRVLIKGKTGSSGKALFENLSVVCFWYGQIGHSNDSCNEAVGHPSGGIKHPLDQENILETQPSPKEVGAEMVADLGVEEERGQL